MWVRAGGSGADSAVDSKWHSRLFEQSGGAVFEDGVWQAIPRAKPRAKRGRLRAQAARVGSGFRTHSGPMPLQPMPTVQRYGLSADRRRSFGVWVARACALCLVAVLITLAGCGGGKDSAASSPNASAPPTAAPSPAAPLAGSAGSTGPTGADPSAQTPRNALSAQAPDRVAANAQPSREDAARFLTQATFGVASEAQIEDLRSKGYELWLWEQFQKPAASQLDYLKQQKPREASRDYPQGKFTEEMSYEAVWKHWLSGDDQLRARTSWALLQIFVISNIAPDIRPLAMSSYMDMLNKNAFGSYRTLLNDVTLHPAMGYYLNMLESEKEDAATGSTPNENYAREVLQLFSIGLYQLNADGSRKLQSGLPISTYGEPEVRGFAKAFSGWSYGPLDNTKADTFHNHDDNADDNWTQAMKAWPMWHSTGEKRLLNGATIPAGGTPEADMNKALDNIFAHPNVGPFIATRLIQRMVTSNPSPAYVQRVAATFDNNGAGQRGDLKAVVRAVLLDAEARAVPSSATVGKQREPVIRLANFLRATGATSRDGTNRIHYLDSADDGLGQSPLLAPSVFNFYSPFFTPAGSELSRRALVAPEFQITTEISVVGSLNFFSRLVGNEGYGWPEEAKMRMNLEPWIALAGNRDALLDRANATLFAYGMSASTRATLGRAIDKIAASERRSRVKALLTLSAVAPDFVIQK